MKRTMIVLATMAAVMGTMMTPAFAATYTSSNKEIDINQGKFAAVDGLTKNDTTYMPIWYVQQALAKAGIQNTWDGSNWHIDSSANVSVSGSTGNGPVSLYANDTLVYQVDSIVKDGTTYLPVWYVMQILSKSGVHNTWDGTNWDITLGHMDGPAPSISLQNSATDDSAYWNRASNNLYVGVQTDGFYKGSEKTPLLSAKPGQTLSLSAYSDSIDVGSGVKWFVNSPDGTFSSGPNLTLSINGRLAQVKEFVASKPGIYTIQAESGSKYSIPLVVIVGMNDLTGPSIQTSASQDGVEPLPSGLPSAPEAQDGTVTYQAYQPQNGWLPVSGHVSGGKSSIVVDFSENNGEEWTYTLPVNADGEFSGMLRIPLTGEMTISFFPNYLSDLNTNGGWTSDSSYEISNTEKLSAQDQGLLASGFMDYNMSSDFNDLASVLMDNAPSKKAGMAAISNYASERIVYDWADYESGKAVFQDSVQALKTNRGVCEDIAELTATMLRSVGIPAETIIGAAPKNSGGDNHEWLQAWDGTEWVIMDPTWDSPNQDINSYLTSEYFTDTSSLQGSHQADASSVGTYQ